MDLFGNGNPYVADRNIGAEDLDDFGLYFTYGEIVPWSEDPLWRFKESPSTANNFWCLDGSHLFKYNANCTLDAMDDPATVWLGPGWTTLNHSLNSAVTWSPGWVYPVDGGNKTRSVTGAGGIIYLPAAGYRNNSSYYGDEGRYLTPWDANADNKWGDHYDESKQISFGETGNSYDSFTRQAFLSVRAVSTIAPEYKNLSALSSANTYIVSAAGKYKFKATVKGNGGLDPLTGTTATTIDPADIAGVKVLWELYNDQKKGITPAYHTIKYDGGYEISYSDGYVCFSTPDTFQQGAACVAIFDSSDNILWSWLIWATPEPGTVIHNGKTFMDKNLGATTRSGYSSNYERGFLYQWGRKDGFSAAAGSIDEVYWFTPVAEEVFIGITTVESVAYTIAHPTTRIACWTSSTHSWMPEEEYSTSPWRADVKTIYDPCPPGWKVPAKEDMSNITGLPDTGLYGSDSPGLRNFGNAGTGYYWTSTISDDPTLSANAYAFCNDGRDIKNWSQAEGYAIRPVRE